MTATAIHTLQSHLGDQVTVHGWVTHFRSSGKIHFLMVRDGTGVVQCIIRPGQAVLEGPWVTEWDQLGTEMAVSLDGTVHADPRAPGGVEISLTRLRVLSESPDYPIQPKEHGVDFLLDHRHLWIRSPPSGRDITDPKPHHPCHPELSG